METQYVKETVGPILASALTSLVLHTPNTEESSYTSTIDPISYIGQYLLNHSKKQQEQQSLFKKIEANQQILYQWKETQNREKANRNKLGEDLNARISVRRSQIERENDSEPENTVAAPIPEPVVEVPEPTPEPAVEPVEPEKPTEEISE